MESVYERVGGEDAVRRLVDRFYDVMDEDPEAAVIRAMHPANLANARERLFAFLSGWLGGPPLYWERHGHPRLRMRHAPFPIGDAEALAWMRCMRVALAEVVVDAPLRQSIDEALAGVALHMRNQAT